MVDKLWLELVGSELLSRVFPDCVDTIVFWLCMIVTVGFTGNINNCLALYNRTAASIWWTNNLSWAVYLRGGITCIAPEYSRQ